jgi:protein-S-isoprenylcysteine O-methyltransferase Ste14
MSDATAERGAAVRFPPPLVFLGFVILGVALHYGVGALSVPVTLWARVAGAIVLLLGVAIIASALNWFTRTRQDPKPWKPTPELIFQGPYRFTRNPIYLGMTCIQIGLGAAVGILWISLLAPVALLGVHFIAVRPEEKYLTEKFGASYGEYLARVRRYL